MNEEDRVGDRKRESGREGERERSSQGVLMDVGRGGSNERCPHVTFLLLNNCWIRAGPDCSESR